MSNETTDYGCDPIGDGTFRLVPSGKIVDREGWAEWKSKQKVREVKNDCMGLSWEEIERKQGGRLTK